MPSTFVALCWKEYRELRWNVLAMVGIGIAMPLYALMREGDTAFSWVIVMLAVYSVIGGICFGMWGAAGERANRSASFVQALPISPLVVGAIKLLILIIAAFVPILVLALLGMTLKPFAENHVTNLPNIWFYAGCYFAIAIHIALTTATFGLGQRTELLAAGVGILALAIWGVCSILSNIAFQINGWGGPEPLMFLGPPIYLLLIPANPESNSWSLLPWIPLTVIAMVGLAGTFVTHYAAAIRPLQSKASARAGLWISGQFASPLASLVVKQLCETAPLVLLVLGSAILLSGGFGTVGEILQPSNSNWVENAGRLFVIFIFLGGFLLSLLLGVMAFAGDVEPKVNTFWRSRPISPTLWFWSKYLIAIGSLIGAIGLPAICCLCLIEYFGSGGHIPSELLIQTCFVALGWFGIFSAGVLSTCIIRRPLHAGLLAFALAAVALGAAQWIDPGWFGGQPLEHPLLVAGLWFSLSIAATLTAWWVAVRDVMAFQ